MIWIVIALFCFVPIIAYLDYLVFGQSFSNVVESITKGDKNFFTKKEMLAELETQRWKVYLAPTFLEFLCLVLGFLLGFQEGLAYG